MSLFAGERRPQRRQDEAFGETVQQGETLYTSSFKTSLDRWLLDHQQSAPCHIAQPSNERQFRRYYYTKTRIQRVELIPAYEENPGVKT